MSRPAHFPLIIGEASCTRYGADATDPNRAGSVLRARAAAGGVSVQAAGPLDLAAATVAADAWLWLCGTDTFDHPAAHGQAALTALAAILSRAAGHRRYITGVLFDVERVDLHPESFDAVESYLRWAEQHTGEGAGVLRRAAADLSAGFDLERTRTERRLSAFASLLDVTVAS